MNILGGNRPSTVDPRLVVNVGDVALCCCPAGIKKTVACGVRFEDTNNLPEFTDNDELYYGHVSRLTHCYLLLTVVIS